jgi:uncharacterized protein (DUF4415 family)
MDSTRKPDAENPEWTAADFARAQGPDILPPEMLAAFPETKKRGRPTGSNKLSISLRLDREIVEKFKATGPGWQSRINEALRKVAP